MEKSNLEEKILCEIWDNILKINQSKGSDLVLEAYYFSLDIHRRLERISALMPKIDGLIQFYEDVVFGEDKKAYIQKVSESPYLSDRVALLHLSDRFVDKYSINIEKVRGELTDKVWLEQHNSKINAMDNVLKAQYIHYFLRHGMNDKVKKEYLDELILDLSNIEVWKYDLVSDPEYRRKIHNSYHFSNPFFLFYWISLCQQEQSILDSKDFMVLKKVIEDGNRNLAKLSSLSCNLLAISSGMEGLVDRERLIKEAHSKFMQIHGSDEMAIYFNYKQFGNKVLGSRLLGAVICLEGEKTTGSYKWKEFREENVNSNQEILDKELSFHKKDICNQRKIHMIMKNHCMAPVLDEGDEIEVSFDLSIQVNDILVFRHYNGLMMAHRVLDVIESGDKRGKVYITGADNGSLWNYPVFQKDVVGKVVNIQRSKI